MFGLNHTIILGRLGDKPQLKKSKNGRSYATLSIATERWRSSEGDRTPESLTDWHNVTVWGKNGENCANYLTKGQIVAVEGYLSTFKSEQPQGGTIKRVSITAHNVHFLSASERRGAQDESIS